MWKSAAIKNWLEGGNTCWTWMQCQLPLTSEKKQLLFLLKRQKNPLDKYAESCRADSFGRVRPVTVDPNIVRTKDELAGWLAGGEI